MKALEAKVVVLGSHGVGKTSLIRRYISRLHSKPNGNDSEPTIGASFSKVKIIIDDFKVKMQVWDTAGQERFRAMAPMYYRNANAALLVFDISNHKTFADVKVWVKELQKNVQDPMVLILVGAKRDLNDKRTVSREEAYLYAVSIGGSFFETSTILDQGIEQVFEAAALGLITLSHTRTATTLLRYESVESVSTYCSADTPVENGHGIYLGEAIDAANDEVATGIGRLETPSWSIDHIAHGYVHKSSWCCY